MLPRELKAEHFKGYPAQGRELAAKHLSLLRQLPLVFLPILLREVIEFDWKFPLERSDLENQLTYLDSLSTAQRTGLLSSFERFTPPANLDRSDMVVQPGRFEQRLTAWLWSTRQMDAFQTAAKQYEERLNATNPSRPPVLPRLSIVTIGQGVQENSNPLFRKLRPHGVHFTEVSSENGMALLHQAVTTRARTHPLSFGHWYIDGGSPFEATWDGVTCMSYAALEPMRAALLHKMRTAIKSGEIGPEELRIMLLGMQPGELGGSERDPVLSRFQASVLTEGSGTQIFSTSFAQWTAREALRRAQPVTMLLRFALRQRQRSMDEILSATNPASETDMDPMGSLIDADMGGYYTWINQQRLSGASESSFLIWFEGHKEALAIGPSMPKGTTSSKSIDLGQILALVG
ncbi:MAG: hypothetical protein WBQ94_13080 [Terracidiphilus sp.]